MARGWWKIAWWCFWVGWVESGWVAVVGGSRPHTPTFFCSAFGLPINWLFSLSKLLLVTLGFFSCIFIGRILPAFCFIHQTDLPWLPRITGRYFVSDYWFHKTTVFLQFPLVYWGILRCHGTLEVSFLNKGLHSVDFVGRGFLKCRISVLLFEKCGCAMSRNNLKGYALCRRPPAVCSS